MEEIKKVCLTDDELNNSDKQRLIEQFMLQDKYVKYLEENFRKYKQENERKYKDLEDAKSLEILKLKNLLLIKYMREQEQASQLQDLQNLISTSKTRQTYLDPVVNLAFIQMKKELDESKRQKDEAQDELNAWKFTSDSQMGKRLIAKCKKLMQENEELGKMISNGNVSDLEADIAYHKRLLSDAYENEQGLYNFIGDMNDEMEGMQASMMQLHQKLGSRSSNSSDHDKKS